MTFSLTTLFVTPTDNTLPTSGSTNNLTPGQFGIYLPDYTPATVGTIGNAKYFYCAQGRLQYAPGEGTKRSDRIYPSKMLEWYMQTGQQSSSVQIDSISNLTIGCNEDVTVTLRLHSMYIDTAYANGLTRSVMVTSPCCNCGSNPCDTLTAENIQLVMEQLAAAINADELLSQFVLASTTGTGTGTTILIGGLPLNQYGLPCDLTAFPYQYDRMYFWTFLRTGPELTTDYEITDACNPVGTVLTLQRSSYPKLVWKEIHQLELDYYSYQAEYKAIFKDPGFNGEWEEYADAPVYNFYYLKFKEPVESAGWANTEPQDEAVMLYIPQGYDAGIAAILTAALGAPDNATQTEPTTSTTTTTSTSTTSTTTYLYP